MRGWSPLFFATLLIIRPLAAPTLVLADPPDSVRIERLIRMLGSDSFTDREDASSELEKLGPEAIPALHQAMTHEDAEIRIRATRLFRTHIEGRFGKEEPVQRLQREGKISRAAFSPDGKYAATAGEDKKARVWDVSTGKQICCCEGHFLPVVGMAFSADGQQLVTTSRDTSVGVWEVKTGKRVREFTNSHRESLGISAFSRDSKYVVSAGHYVNVLTWDLERNNVQACRVHAEWTTECHPEIKSVGISPDHRLVAVGFEDGTLSLWDFETWKNLQKFVGHTGAVHGLAFSSDGKRLVSGGKDATVRLWDTATGKEIARCKATERTVHSVTLTPDAHFALSGGAHVTLWHLPSGRELRSYRPQIGNITSVSLSSDGCRIIASGDRDGVVIWGPRR